MINIYFIVIKLYHIKRYKKLHLKMLQILLNTKSFVHCMV